MIDKVLEGIATLINERASAAVLQQHLELLRTECALLEARCKHLETGLQNAQLDRQQAQDQLRRFTNDNPRGLRCEACGSPDLRQVGASPHPVFGDVGMKNASMLCRVCNHTSLHEIPLP